MFCRASCIVYLTSAWSKTCSSEHWWFARAWFSRHPGCSILRKHVASTQGSDWLLSKPTLLSQMAGWGDVPTGSKNNGLNQPKAWEPCTMHCTCHKTSCRITCLASKQLQQFEQRVLQTGSSEGGLQWQREGQQPRSTRYMRPWIHGGTGVCKARFQGAASLCSRWPIASFMLSGFTNPVHLHPVYPCILGLRFEQCFCRHKGTRIHVVIKWLTVLLTAWRVSSSEKDHHHLHVHSTQQCKVFFHLRHTPP